MITKRKQRLGGLALPLIIDLMKFDFLGVDLLNRPNEKDRRN